MNQKFTIIIPIYNENESIFKLIKEINVKLRNENPEIIIIDDGSTDNFFKNFSAFNWPKNISVQRHKKNSGKCYAMLTGIKRAKNEIIVCIDGDGQNPPSEIKKLMNAWYSFKNSSKTFLLVCGERIKRKDNFLKKVSSKLANKFRKYLLNDQCNDTACALKVFNKSDYLSIEYFKNMHRYLPALFIMQKGKIINVPVKDRPRESGKSKFNFHNRFWIGIIDLIKVWILINKKRGENDSYS